MDYSAIKRNEVLIHSSAMNLKKKPVTKDQIFYDSIYV